MDQNLYAYTYADVAFDDAIEVLATDPRRLFQDATDQSSDHVETVVRDLAIDVAGFQLAREITIDLGEVEPVEALRSVVPVRWHASRGRSFFPTVDARLEIAALSLHPPRVQVTLVGSYDPPFGPAGDAIDRAVAHRIAESVVHRFITEVAARLEVVVRESDLTSHI